MPVIAIGAAIAADVVAGGALAGTIGGIAAISATTAFEVVAAVGATLGAIGAITKDRTLSMIGLGIGAVGAIGGLASASGLLGDGSAPLFGTAPTATTEDAAAGASFSDSLTPATAGTGSGPIDAGTWDGAAASSAADAASSNTIGFLTDASAAPPDGYLSLAQTTKDASDPAAALTGAGSSDAAGSTGLINSSASTDAATAAPTVPGISGPETSAASSDLIPPPAAPPNGLGAVDPATGNTITSAVDPATGKIVSLPDSESGISGVLGKIINYAGAHPVVAFGALQAGGSLLSGMTSSLTPAQVSALNAQAAANNAAAALTVQQNKNLAMPKAVASSSAVTGTPAPLVPQSAVPGIINRTAEPAVTGAPA